MQNKQPFRKEAWLWPDYFANTVAAVDRGQVELYNCGMPPKTVNYSKARAELRALIEEVHRTGRPVAILRRGRPEAVLISYEEFERKLHRRSRPWRLEGTLRLKAGVDLDAAIEQGRKEMRDALEARLTRYERDLDR